MKVIRQCTKNGKKYKLGPTTEQAMRASVRQGQ
jgi:hypothetical protein